MNLYTLWQVVPDGHGEYEDAELDRGVSIPGIATGHALHTYLENNGWLTGVSKWDTAVSIHGDGTIELEDVSTGRPLFRLTPEN